MGQHLRWSGKFDVSFAKLLGCGRAAVESALNHCIQAVDDSC